MISKKYLCYLGIATMILGGCGDHPAKQDNTSVPVKLGITVYRSDDLFMRVISKAIITAVEKMPDVQWKLMDSKYDQNLQNKQIDQMIQDGDQTFLINIVETTHSTGNTLIEKMRIKNLPIVFYNRDPGKKVIDSYDKAYYVGSIPAQSGIMQGEMIVKNWLNHPEWDLNHDGVIQYVILKGGEGNPDAEGRTKWVGATIQNYPNHGIAAEELAVVSANWQTDQAKDQTDKWLNSDLREKIELIIANNDAMAIGAVESLQAHQLHLPVFGVDAMPEALQLIQQGKMTGTVLQDTITQGREAINLAVNLARKQDPSLHSDYPIVDRYLMIPYIPIDKNNLEQYLKKENSYK